MNTLIVPCAGRSSRFPNMRPKWMLTHPDGNLMLIKSLSGLDLRIFNRIIIVIVKAHDEGYEASLILKQAFSDIPEVEICILDDFTSSVVETVLYAVRKMDITGSIVIRDSDNFVVCKIPTPIPNAIACLDIGSGITVTNLAQKSFAILNEQGVITNIQEKRIISQFICLGVYCFEDCAYFIDGAEALEKESQIKELYISHVISWLIINKNLVFHCLPVTDYQDWGTITEWRAMQLRNRTFFVDLDGILLKNSGKYGSINWNNNKDFIQENVNALLRLQTNGAQIVIVTSRPESLRDRVIKLLTKMGIIPFALLMGLNHAPRVLINDFASSNPYPSASAINVPRNSSLLPYLGNSQIL